MHEHNKLFKTKTDAIVIPLACNILQLAKDKQLQWKEKQLD